MAVNPASGKAYLSIASRGRVVRPPMPVIVRVDRAQGRSRSVSLAERPLRQVDPQLANVPTAPASGAPAPKKGGMGGNARNQAITDLAFVDGRVYIAGLSNEEFASRLVSIPYPFARGQQQGTSVEIYHGAHGAVSRPGRRSGPSPPYKINGEALPDGRLHLHPARQVPPGRPQARHPLQGHDRCRTGQPQQPARHGRLSEGRQGLSPAGQQQPEA